MSESNQNWPELDDSVPDEEELRLAEQLARAVETGSVVREEAMPLLEAARLLEWRGRDEEPETGHEALREAVVSFAEASRNGKKRGGNGAKVQSIFSRSGRVSGGLWLAAATVLMTLFGLKYWTSGSEKETGSFASERAVSARASGSKAAAVARVMRPHAALLEAQALVLAKGLAGQPLDRARLDRELTTYREALLAEVKRRRRLEE